jgi:hypothetical protein
MRQINGYQLPGMQGPMQVASHPPSIHVWKIPAMRYNPLVVETFPPDLSWMLEPTPCTHNGVPTLAAPVQWQTLQTLVLKQPSTAADTTNIEQME